MEVSDVVEEEYTMDYMVRESVFETDDEVLGNG